MSVHVKPSFNSQKESVFFSKDTAFKRKEPSAPFSRNQTFARKPISKAHAPSTNDFSSKPPQEKQPHISSSDSLSDQVNQKLALINDPLWKKVCADVSHIIGPFATLRIWSSKLGSLSIQDRVVELYCPTENTAQFLRKYDFVVLASLQQYFPALRKICVTSDTDRKNFTYKFFKNLFK